MGEVRNDEQKVRKHLYSEIFYDSQKVRKYLYSKIVLYFQRFSLWFGRME